MPADDPRLPLLNQVGITLHARLNGSSTLDWQPPPGRQDAKAQATLDTAHRGIEQTLLGVLKLWAPLVNGSIAESFGEDNFVLAQSENSYPLRSQDKQHALTERFDRNLLLTQYISTESGGAIPQTTAPETDQETRAAFEYAPVSQARDRAQPIPVKLAIEIPNVVTMNFALDTCSQEPDGVQ